MTQIKRILITGDDGYNSIGIRLLVHYLQKDFDLSVAATLHQMSGVGGALSIRNGGKWGETTIDGVPVFWVDGYPCDAMELSVGYYPRKFDLVISGINMGMNIGGAIVSSGTYSAAVRAVNLGLAPRALALSWHCPPEYWQVKHNGDEDLKNYLKHPGVAADKVVRLAIAKNLWGADILNINFPSFTTDKVRFTKGISDLKQFFKYPIPMDRNNHTFAFPNGGLNQVAKKDLYIDTNAMLAGYISVTPHHSHSQDLAVYTKMKGREINL